MEVVVGGASGFLGAALVDHLRTNGHQVTRLVRSGSGDGASRWDPAAGVIDQGVIDRADAVVSLSGASVGRWPRTRRYGQQILESRTTTTSTIANAIAKSPTPPAMLSGSAMAYYGIDRGDEVLTESSSAGSGFLPDVVHAWEDSAAPAIDAGARVCFLRTTLVLDASGGMLRLMRPVFKLGAGARLGPGTQYMSFISQTDWIRAVTFLLESTTASGPFNLTMPQSQTNAEFTDVLGETLHRPTFLVVPTLALKAALGNTADDLLGSLRLSPKALTDAGFEFEHPDLRSTIEAALA